MSHKENLQGNKVIATLYVGVGGIGSDVVRGVVDIAKENKDDLTKARFVTLDTDVGSLKNSDDGVYITPIQTSSPRTIRDYLVQDEDARNEWFPNNMIINSKTVSEGAGQVRAISRLALNATIKTGRIKALYRAIDELYRKDGEDKKQPIKVVIASTVAGGTGSGIAMIVGMLIRNYLSKNYPESSAVIRGFLMMPDVLNTFGPSSSEEQSLQRNGYATLKEINAFMMRPFFEAVPELNRYLDLHVDVPNPEGGIDRLTTSPFDFCFLFERVDSGNGAMGSLGQYKAYMSHSIYEQSIGAMSVKAASAEDNIHKEFLDEKKLSRNRFGGAGASIVRYPYREIRDYVAYEWIEEQIIGQATAEMSDEDVKKLVADSWLAYDSVYNSKVADFKAGNTNEEPIRSETYMFGLETGTDQFSKMLREKYIDPKNARNRNTVALGSEMPDSSSASEELIESDDSEVLTTASNAVDSNIGEETETIPAVENFINELIKKAFELYESTPQKQDAKALFMLSKSQKASQGECQERFDNICGGATLINPNELKSVVKSFIERNFNSPNKIDKKTEAYMVEDFLSIDGKALHPNAMRYMLYKLFERAQTYTKTTPEKADFDKRLDIALYGNFDKNGNRIIKPYQVSTSFGKEETLSDMCDACDKTSSTDSSIRRCNELLSSLARDIYMTYISFVRFYVCQAALPYIERLCKQFEDFYDTFQKKVVGLEKRKKTLLTQIEFNNGDCVYNLFSKPEYLKRIVDEQKKPASGSNEERELFADIYNALKENGKSHDMLRSNSFADAKVVDVFDDVLVESYKEIVEEACPGLDMDIVRACGMECQIAAMCKAEYNPNEAEQIIAEGKSDIARNAYLRSIIERGKSLASPSLIRKSFEEDRSINAMAFNSQMEEGDGMHMPDSIFNRKDFGSNTVSKYELHFFRSIYGLMPTELHKMSSPVRDPGKPDAEGTAEEKIDTDVGMVGVYFTAYQNYMQKIGPDNRLNPVITPHIDKRWNSISVMPELDPQGYQRVLMKRIHKALIYGLIFGIIEKNYTSPHDMKKFVYEYLDGRSGTKKLTVSNHTKCDRLFEVLDALYFDRYAVHSIHSNVDAIREKEFTRGTPYEKTSFNKYLNRFDRDVMLNEHETVICDNADSEITVGERLEALKGKKTSIFEIPLLYWKSLPNKDAAELEIMVDAVLEILQAEICKFASKDDEEALVAESICKHYDVLYENYNTCKCIYDNLEIDPKNHRAFKVIRKKVIEKIDDLDVTKESFRICDHTDTDDLFAQ